MHSKLLLPLATFATLLHAVQIPHDLNNGIYDVQFSKDGKPTFTKTHEIDAILPRAALPPPPTNPHARSLTSVLDPRDNGPPSDGSINCVSNGLLYDYDLHNAQSLRADWCDAGNTVWGGSLKIAQYFTASAYLCNYSGNSQGCSSGEVYGTGNKTVDQCGTQNGGNDGNPGYTPGSYFDVRTAEAYDFSGGWQKTYGFDLTGASICDNL